MRINVRRNDRLIPVMIEEDSTTIDLGHLSVLDAVELSEDFARASAEILMLIAEIVREGGAR